MYILCFSKGDGAVRLYNICNSMLTQKKQDIQIENNNTMNSIQA